MGRETEEGHGGDEPLGWIVLVPLDRVTIVHGELVVEVVVPLTQGEKGGDGVITGGVLVVKGRLAEPVSQRIDTESRLRAANRNQKSRREAE